MRPFTLSMATALALLSTPLRADLVDDVLDQHILPGMEALAQTGTELAQTTQTACHPGEAALQDSYAAAFDAWIRVSHLRFGPTEKDNRAFALAFWPDSRGKTPKTLAATLRKEDPAIADPAIFAQSSIAGRGFYALEYLLYDPSHNATPLSDYQCALIRAIATDIAANSQAIAQDWRLGYADQMREATGRYASEAEVKQELFKALDTGLQIVADMRLGRPLGTFDRPRPKRAEAWRSARSQRHILLSLEALRPLAVALAANNPPLATDLDATFGRAVERARQLDDPQLAGVSDPAKRLRIEALQSQIQQLKALIETELGPTLGVTAGFNSLDGD